jgi:hypothetical protein
MIMPDRKIKARALDVNRKKKGYKKNYSPY